jgi:hypothetical protein
MALQKVDRIKTPSREVFWNEYVLKQKPVIITDLFKKDPIRKANTLEAAAKAYGSLPLKVRDTYSISELVHTRETGKLVDVTLGEYLKLISTDPDFRKVCTEYVVPENFLSEFKLPGICQSEVGSQRGKASRSKNVKYLFIAKEGSRTHTHFDPNQFHTIQYQVFGSKRIIMIPPNQAPKLIPHKNYSMIFFDNMREHEKRSFVRYVDGYDCVVEEGETLFMPALVWHYLEYAKHTMSLTLRFGRNQYNEFFGEHLHPSMHLQNIATRFIDERNIDDEARAAFVRIVDEYTNNKKAGYEKFQDMQRLFEQIYSELCRDCIQGQYAITGIDLAGTTKNWIELRGFYTERWLKNALAKAA